jgi:hypothetical protein
VGILANGVAMVFAQLSTLAVNVNLYIIGVIDAILSNVLRMSPSVEEA